MFPTRALLSRSVWKGNYPTQSHALLNPIANLPAPPQVLSSFRKSPTAPLGYTKLTPCDSLPIQRNLPVGQKPPPVKTQARSCTILPDFVNMVFQVHNGKDYVDVLITEDMVGHKLGEFAP